MQESEVSIFSTVGSLVGLSITYANIHVQKRYKESEMRMQNQNVTIIINCVNSNVIGAEAAMSLTQFL